MSLALQDDLLCGCSAHLIPCGGSFVYLRDIWRSPIGKFLFTSVVIQSLLTRLVVSANCSFENVQPEIGVSAADPLHHGLHQLLAEVQQEVAVLRGGMVMMVM